MLASPVLFRPQPCPQPPPQVSVLCKDNCPSSPPSLSPLAPGFLPAGWSGAGVRVPHPFLASAHPQWLLAQPGSSSSKPPASRNPHGQMQALTHESSVHPIPRAGSPAPPGIFAPHTPLPAWKAARKWVFEDSKGPFSLGDTLSLILIGLGITLPPSSHRELLWEGQHRRSCPIKMVEAHGE